MAMSPAMIDAMVSAGLTAEQMATLLKAHLAAEANAVDEKARHRREATAERVRRHRETHRNAGNARNALPPSAPPGGPPLPPAPPTPPLNPPAIPGSDPAGSAAGAAGEQRDGSEECDEAGDAEGPNAVRRVLLGRGVDLVCANTGRSKHSARSLIGHWLGIARDEASVVLAIIEEADGRELIDFSSWVGAQLRQRRDRGPDNDPPSGRRSPPPRDRPTGMAGRLIRLHEQSMSGAYDVEPPSVDANEPSAEPTRGEDRGLAWSAGGASRPSDALLRAAGEGGHDSRASRALRMRRAAGG